PKRSTSARTPKIHRPACNPDHREPKKAPVPSKHQASRDARERRERARACMPMLDRAFALNMQTSLYALGSHAQVILCRIRTLPFQNNFGRVFSDREIKSSQGIDL